MWHDFTRISAQRQKAYLLLYGQEIIEFQLISSNYHVLVR